MRPQRARQLFSGTLDIALALTVAPALAQDKKPDVVFILAGTALDDLLPLFKEPPLVASPCSPRKGPELPR
jgi:hypothetical protein